MSQLCCVHHIHICLYSFNLSYKMIVGAFIKQKYNILTTTLSLIVCETKSFIGECVLANK